MGDSVRQDTKSASKPPKLQLNLLSAQSSGQETQKLVKQDPKQALSETVKLGGSEKNQQSQKQALIESPLTVSKQNKKQQEIDKKKKDSPGSENKRIKKATLKVVERSKKKDEEQENGNASTLPASVEEEKGKDEEDMGDEDDEECQVICTKTKGKENRQQLKRKKKTHQLEKVMQKKDIEGKGPG